MNKFHLKVPKSCKRKMDNGNVSLEVTENKDKKKIYIVVFRSAMRQTLFVGHLVAESRMKRVEDKAAKNQLKMLIKHKPKTMSVV